MIEFNEEVDEFNASVLITNLLEWMKIFKNEEEIKNVIDYLYKKFPNMTLNTIQIDLESGSKINIVVLLLFVGVLYP